MLPWHFLCCRTHLHTYCMHVRICALLYVVDAKAPCAGEYSRSSITIFLSPELKIAGGAGKGQICQVNPWLPQRQVHKLPGVLCVTSLLLAELPSFTPGNVFLSVLRELRRPQTSKEKTEGPVTCFFSPCHMLRSTAERSLPSLHVFSQLVQNRH